MAIDEATKAMRESMGWATPLAVVTLKRAEDGDKFIWTVEDEQLVRDIVNNATTRLITLTRVKAMKAEPFHTRPDNVVNIAPMEE